MLFRFKPEFPVIEFDTLSNSNFCEKIESCQRHIREINNNLKRYVTRGKPYRKQVISAILPVPLSLVDYVKRMRKIHKGNAVREVKKAEKKEYYYEVFHIQNHVEDLVEINHSKEINLSQPVQKTIND